MVLIFFLLLGVAEEDYRQVVLLGFRLCCKQPRLLCTVFTEDLYGRINLGHLCGFFFLCFVIHTQALYTKEIRPVSGLQILDYFPNTQNLAYCWFNLFLLRLAAPVNPYTCFSSNYFIYLFIKATHQAWVMLQGQNCSSDPSLTCVSWQRDGEGQSKRGSF